MGAPIPIKTLESLLAKPGIGSAAWLYLTLLVHALPSGCVIRTRSRLAEDLSTDEEEVDRQLDRLSSAGLIELQSPSPYLVIRIRSWSSSATVQHEIPLRYRGAAPVPPMEVPVSSLQQHASAAETKNKQEDRGTGEGEALVDQARAILGDTPGTDLADLLAIYPDSIVRQALGRVRSIPAPEIRKSKMALFRYLLNKLPQSAHVPHATRRDQP